MFQKLKINGVIERYQRTIQEEFLEPNLDLIHYPKLFNDKEECLKSL